MSIARLACVSTLTVTLGMFTACPSVDAQDWGLVGPPADAMRPPLLSAPTYSPAADNRPVAEISGLDLERADDPLARLAEIEAALAQFQAERAEATTKAASKPTVRVGGNIQWDWAAFSQNPTSLDQIGRQFDGTEFRRARIRLQGKAFQNMEYKAEYDFADRVLVSDKTLQSTGLRDLYIQFNELPRLAHLRVGRFIEPFRLNNLSFMERALADQSGFVPRRNSGIMAYDTYAQERGTWAIAGSFGDLTYAAPLSEEDTGDRAVTMRGTYLPVYDEATNGRELWHVEASYSYRKNPNDYVRFRQRPECHLADLIVDTGLIPDVSHWQIMGVETAYVRGPFSVQGAWRWAFVQRDLEDDLFYNGGYVLLSYFLTGEYRTYNRAVGRFSHIKLRENFFRVRDSDGQVRTGKGAWEILYRCSHIDLSEFVTPDNLPGNVCNHTIGLNWYLNPYARIAFNYVNSTLDNDMGSGSLNIFQMRTQIRF